MRIACGAYRRLGFAVTNSHAASGSAERFDARSNPETNATFFEPRETIMLQMPEPNNLPHDVPHWFDLLGLILMVAAVALAVFLALRKSDHK